MIFRLRQPRRASRRPLRRRWIAAPAALVLAGSPVAAPVAALAAPAVAQLQIIEPPASGLPGPDPLLAAPDPLMAEDVYILGPGDGLNLRFLAVPEFSGPLEILNDGSASLPLLGNVVLSGLTLSQASQWLETLYRAQLQRPNLQLSVVRPRPLRVAVVGEVKRPGLYTLTTAEKSRTEAEVAISGPPALVDAIQKAGGLTPSADLRRVWLQRRLPGNDRRFKQAQVDLLALVRLGDQFQNPLLFDGDTIRIERVAAESAELSAELASSTLSPTEITVNVVGEVTSPGRLQVPANTPLMQAILAAGGPQSWRADKANVELVRIFRNGSAQRLSYAYDPGQDVSMEENPPLVDGDTVIVNRSRYAVSTDAIGAVTEPLTGLVNVLTLFRLLDD